MSLPAKVDMTFQGFTITQANPMCKEEMTFQWLLQPILCPYNVKMK